MCFSGYAKLMQAVAQLSLVVECSMHARIVNERLQLNLLLQIGKLSGSKALKVVDVELE
jgi:hypothetical protein